MPFRKITNWIGASSFIALIQMTSNTDAVAATSFDLAVTRAEANFYRVDGTDFIIETRFCFVFAFSERAILNVRNPRGYNIGEVIFLDMNDRCDVRAVYQRIVVGG